MPISAYQAYITLGIPLLEPLTARLINNAWKIKIKEVHPDKNQGSAASTALSQRYNDARDTLLARLCNPAELAAEKKARDAEDEKKAIEKEKALAEMRRQQEAASAAAAGGGKKTRKHRAPGSRVHRKISGYGDGKILLEAMRQYFLGTYCHVPPSNCRVLVADVLDGFIKHRPATTPLETRLFQRHGKRVFLETITGAVYGKYKDRRCFARAMKKDA